MADPTPTEAPTPAPTAAPTPAPSIAEQQLAATLRLAAAQERLANVHQAILDAEQDPRRTVAFVAARLMPHALEKNDPQTAASVAVTWAKWLIEEARTRAE